MSLWCPGCWRLPQLTNEEPGYPELTNQRPGLVTGSALVWQLLVITTSADTRHLGSGHRLDNLMLKPLDILTKCVSSAIVETWHVLWSLSRVWGAYCLAGGGVCLSRAVLIIRPASCGHEGRKSRQNMVRTVIEMWRAIRGTETNNGKHNWRNSSFYYFSSSCAPADHSCAECIDDDERMRLVCIKLEKLVDKNLSF